MERTRESSKRLEGKAQAPKCYSTRYIYIDVKNKKELFRVTTYNYENNNDEEFLGCFEPSTETKPHDDNYDAIVCVQGDGTMVPLHRTRIAIKENRTLILRDVNYGYRITRVAKSEDDAGTQSESKKKNVIRVTRGDFALLRGPRGGRPDDEIECLKDFGYIVSLDQDRKTRKTDQKSKTWNVPSAGALIASTSQPESKDVDPADSQARKSGMRRVEEDSSPSTSKSVLDDEDVKSSLPFKESEDMPSPLQDQLRRLFETAPVHIQAFSDSFTQYAASFDEFIDRAVHEGILSYRLVSALLSGTANLVRVVPDEELVMVACDVNMRFSTAAFGKPIGKVLKVQAARVAFAIDQSFG